MNVCPGEGVAYDSYYNETDRVIIINCVSLITSAQIMPRLFSSCLSFFVEYNQIPDTAEHRR